MSPVLSDLLDPRGAIAFDRLTPSIVAALVREGVGAGTRALAELLAKGSAVSASDVITFVDEATSLVDVAVGLAEHMDEVLGTEAWRACYESALAERDRLRTSVYGSPALFRLLSSFAATDGAARLDPADGRALHETLRLLRTRGAHLADDARARLARIDEALVEKTREFTCHADASVGALDLRVASADRLRGLPGWAIELARASAAERGEDGHRLTLQIPMVNAVLTFAEDRGLRREVYMAHVTRAARENRPVLEEILALRAERAAVLGYASFGDLATDGLMMRSAASALAFLEELAHGLRGPFAEETASLHRYAAQSGCEPLKPWDVAYCAERARRAEADFDGEELRAHLPFPRVLDAAQELTAHLFDVRWERIDAPAWHEAVSVWHVRSSDGVLATVYVDAFAREGKREGAWMSPLVACVPGRRPGVVVLAADLAPSARAQEPPGLSMEEVARLFHELGHVMHHVLSRTKRLILSGTRVARDFVELPSTLMERLAWEPPVLARLALPPSSIERCTAARRFRAASALLQRTGLAVTDLLLHSDTRRGDALELAASTMERYSPVKLPAGYARIAALTHVFGSTEGYEASLYAYVWAEVLAADALRELGETWDEYRRAGRRLRDRVLARGNELAPEQLVEAFMGRAPSVNALLAEVGA